MGNMCSKSQLQCLVLQFCINRSQYRLLYNRLCSMSKICHDTFQIGILHPNDLLYNYYIKCEIHLQIKLSIAFTCRQEESIIKTHQLIVCT